MLSLPCLWLFLAIISNSLVVNVESVKELKSINWLGFNNTIDPPTLIVSWNEVQSDDDQDPVIGYKVSNIWEVKKIKRIKEIFHDNGTLELVEVEEYPRARRMNGTNVIPEGKLTVIYTSEPKRTVSFRVKFEVPYQLAITAYTRSRMGPPSAITGRTLHGPDWNSDVD